MNLSTSELSQSIALTSGNTTQPTSEIVQSIAFTSGNMTQSTPAPSQSAKDVNDDDTKPAANTDNELSQSTITSSPAQSGTLASVNVSNCAFAKSIIADTIWNELALIAQVRQTNFPSFIVHSLCI
jgi:hypothetical protein